MSSRKPARRAEIWRASQRCFISAAAAWGWRCMHVVLTEVGTQISTCQWGRSLRLQPSSYFLSLSFPVGSALTCAGPLMSRPARREGRGSLFTHRRLSAVIPAGCEWSGGTTHGAGSAALLGRGHGCSMGTMPWHLLRGWRVPEQSLLQLRKSSCSLQPLTGS